MTREELHAMWARIALTIAVGIVVALTDGKTDDTLIAMLLTYIGVGLLP